MILETKVEQKEEGVVSVNCKIKADYVDTVFADITNDIRAKATLKGFRQGKAPLGMIKKVYEGQIKYDVLNKILPEVFEKVTKKEKIKPATTPEFSGYEDIAEGQVLELGFVVETVPEVKEMPALEEIEAKKVEYEYNLEETLQKELDMIKETFAEYKDIEDEAKADDFIKASYTFTPEEGEEKKASSFFLLKEKDPFYALSKNFIGKKIKEEGEVELELPEDFGDKAIAGKKGKIKFTIEEGKRVIYPELDDELAKKAGHKSLDDLKENIQKSLTRQIEEKNLLESADNIYNVIAEKATFSISPSVIVQQSQNDMTQKINMLVQSGKTMEQFFEEEGLTQETFVEKMKEDALENIKKYLIMSKIFEDEKMKITKTEQKNFIKELTEAESVNKKQIKEYYEKNPQAQESLKERIKFIKVANLVLEKAKITGTDKKKLGE